MEKTCFEFPLDNSQQWDGFNEPGVEHFAGNPLVSLAREATQNSYDSKKEGSPARIEIQRIDVDVSSVPDLAGLKAAIKCCRQGAEKESEKAKKFFDAATEVLEKPKLSVLQFSDYNTKGVVGPCENGTPYFALMKATGQSKKESGTASGSFGIGKFAPFTASRLRTVFLTTVWQAKKAKPQHYVQGKSILMSHKKSGKIRRGTGFWGVKENCQPVTTMQGLPKWLVRSAKSEADTGTTLSVLGFTGGKNWERILAAGIAETFFGAISKGNLEVQIKGGPDIKAETLESVFSDEAIKEAIKDQKGEPETFENGGHFLRALTSSEKKVEETQNAKLGHCKLHILVGEKLPKKVAVLRNGMLITSELERLRRFSEFKEFVAVLECVSEAGNALLRAMEPPAHDEFQPARLSTPDEQRAARVALRELADWVRQMLARHAQDPVAEVTELNELSEFFGDDEQLGNTGAREGDENPRGAIKIRARPLTKKKPISPAANQEFEEQPGDEGAEGLGENGNQPGQGQGNGGGGGQTNETEGGDASQGGSGGLSNEAIPSESPMITIRNPRAVVLAPAKRMLAFTPGATGKVNIVLEDSGADTNRLLKITSSSLGTVVDGKLTVACEAEKRTMVEVELERSFEGTVRMRAHAV